MKSNRGSSPPDVLLDGDIIEGSLREPPRTVEFPSDFGAFDALGVLQGSERVESKPVDMNILVEFLKCYTDEQNRAQMDDAIRRLRPIYGNMRNDGSYRLSPESEIDRGHLANVLAGIFRQPVKEIVFVSPASFVFPSWITKERCVGYIDSAIMLNCGSGDFKDLLVGGGYPLLWSQLKVALETSMGDFYTYAPRHLHFPLAESMFVYLACCCYARTAATAEMRDMLAERKRTLTPLIDRLPQLVPLCSLDDGRRWLVRVA